MVQLSGHPRPVPVPRLPREQRRVVRWLASREGRAWSMQQFSDATECHAIIEIEDDLSPHAISDHRADSSEEMLEYLRGQAPQWADLTWTPDVSP